MVNLSVWWPCLNMAFASVFFIICSLYRDYCSFLDAYVIEDFHKFTFKFNMLSLKTALLKSLTD